MTPRLRIRPRLEVYVHEMVRYAVLLRRDHVQVLLEVRGGDQLDGDTGALCVTGPTMATLEGRSERSAWGRRLISHLYCSHYSSAPVSAISGDSEGVQPGHPGRGQRAQNLAAASTTLAWWAR